MEFAFDVQGVLPNAITRILSSQLPRTGNSHRLEGRAQQLAKIVNKLGTASAKAQGLRASITTYQKLAASSHTLYLLRDDGDQPPVIGLLKVGKKKLFLSDLQGVQKEVEPLCVLDFYVHESRQRAGHGKRLFQTMLNMEGTRVTDLAIDRPSTKFLSFLKKHYKLHSDMRQGNNFVVFSQFFQNLNTRHTGTGTMSSLPTTRHSSSQTSSVSVQGPSQSTPVQLNHSIQCPPHGPVIEPSPCQPTPPQAMEPQQPLTPQKPSLTTHPTEVETTPTHRWTFPLTDQPNFNWSPDTVLLRNQRAGNTPCDIITGAPLLTSKWKLPRTQQPQHGWREEGKKAPLLTMREKERQVKGRVLQLDCGGSSQLPALNGYRLVGSGTGTDSAYSRHSHKPIPPSSHTLTLPGQKTYLEPRQSRWKKL